LAVGLQTLAPVLGVGAVIGLSVSLLQTRFMFSFKPLEPKLDKLSPVNGLKRMFSIRSAVETAKSTIKVFLIAGTAMWIMWGRHTDFVALTDSAPLNAVRLTLDLVFTMVMRVSLMLVVVGVADYAYQWWEFERSLRMSHQEIIDEMKQQEGDPHMRARRKNMRRHMLQQGMSRETKEASVVVTNPTHFAVALKYRQGMVAPRVVAKGQNDMAQRILVITRKHGIPEVRNVSVARALYKAASVGDYVPIPLYQAVAEILAFVRRQALQRRQRQHEMAQRATVARQP
jgi:flagellar biosynthesis protein FlhB